MNGPAQLSVGRRPAIGVEDSTYRDHGWTWDNSGRAAHYAPIEWSGQ